MFCALIVENKTIDDKFVIKNIYILVYNLR